MMPSFREWLASGGQLSTPLSQQSPQGAGDLSDNQSNSDYAFGRSGVASKNFGRSLPAEVSKSNPRKLYGVKRRRK